MPHEACFDSFEAEMLEPCGLSAIWVLSTFREYFKSSKQVTTEQVKTLVSGVVDKVKEFVKGGEFEKIHRNETRTRDRDELSR